MKHENILPLLGLWNNFSFEGFHAQYPAAISLWIEDGDLSSYIRDHPDLNNLEKLYFVSP